MEVKSLSPTSRSVLERKNTAAPPMRISARPRISFEGRSARLRDIHRLTFKLEVLQTRRKKTLLMIVGRGRTVKRHCSFDSTGVPEMQPENGRPNAGRPFLMQMSGMDHWQGPSDLQA